LKEIFEANSVAIVGASPNPDRPGFTLIYSMKSHGYRGKIYPVNPKYGEILDLICFESISSIPSDVEVVFFAVAGSLVLSMLDDCMRKGVKAIVIISAGFSEASRKGADLEEKILGKCRSKGIRLLGPNTTGFISFPVSLVASINHFDNWIGGDLAIGGQTGIFAGAYMDEVMSRKSQRLGYDLSVSLGNKADYDEVDFLEYARSLSQVKAIQVYLESIKRPEEFFAIARRLKEERKPIVFLRGGRTEMGRLSTRTHTGSIGQDPRFDDDYLTQQGIIPTIDIEEFFDISKAISYQPFPRGRNVGVVTMSGADGTLAADAADEFKLGFPSFSSKSLELLKKQIPQDQRIENPLDIGFALTSGKETRIKTMQAVIADSNVDSLLMIDLAVANSDFAEVRNIYDELDSKGKPILLVLQGGSVKEKWLTELEGSRIPIYPTPRRALRAIQAMYKFTTSS
jgi:acetate---CoA ligase (ADP-forming)